MLLALVKADALTRNCPALTAILLFAVRVSVAPDRSSSPVPALTIAAEPAATSVAVMVLRMVESRLFSAEVALLVCPIVRTVLAPDTVMALLLPTLLRDCLLYTSRCV